MDSNSEISKLLSQLASTAAFGEGDAPVDEEAMQADMAALEEVLRGAVPEGDGHDLDFGPDEEYAEARAGGKEPETDAEHPFHDDEGAYEEEDYVDDEDDTPLVEMPAGLWPYEVWQQQHASQAAATSGGAPPLETKKLTEKQWDTLVTRLNESSKRKQQALAAIQAKREADELAGSRFTPAISRRSKQIARDNRRLPERVRALMERRQRRQDKLREEAQQREMAEATFKPKLSKPVNGRMAHLMKRMRRRVGHLLQYDVDKQIRARQRQQILQEVEARELTFSPRINANSVRIFNRMRRRLITLDKKLQAGQPLTAEEERLRDGGLTEAARARSRADEELQRLAEAEMEVKAGVSRKIHLDKTGLTRLPGHEEERFHPKINHRSRLIARKGGKAHAHERLYTEFTKAHLNKTRARQQRAQETLRLARTKSSAAFGMGNSEDGLRLGSVGLRGDSLAAAAMSGRSAETEGEVVETRVAYRPAYDFLVRRVLEAQAEEDVRAVDESELDG